MNIEIPDPQNPRKKYLVKLRAGEKGFVVVFPGKDEIKPPITIYSDRTPLVRVEVWPDEDAVPLGFGRKLWLGRWKRKLQYVLRDEVAKLFSELIDPRKQMSLREISNYVEVNLTPFGTVSAHVVIDPRNAETVLAFFNELERVAKKKSYGIRKFLDESIDESELERELIYHLKRFNLLFPEHIASLSNHLRKQGVQPETIFRSLERLKRVLERMKNHRDPHIRELAVLSLPYIDELIKRYKKEHEKELEKIKEELRRGKILNLDIIPRA